jgi:ribose-phosphate pyrophosphokinase
VNRLSEQSLVLGFPDYSEQAQRLADAAGLVYREVDVHRFPDGESRVCLPEDLPQRVVFCRSLHHPNDKLVELALAARTARRLGAGHLTLVAPYLCYMRQDKAFHPGEAISQPIIGRLLAGWFDALVTVDPHLHRIDRLEDAVPASQIACLSAAPLMGRFLHRALDAPLLIGPDSESRQWVSIIAEERGLDYLIGEKERLGDRDVSILFSGSIPAGRHLVLIDDVASTGRTLEAAVEALSQSRPVSVSVLVTHALFLEGALERLHAAGVGDTWSTDSIPHATNRLELAPLLADALH